MYISKGAIYVPNSWRIYLLDFIPRYLQCVLAVPIIFTALGFAGYAVFLLSQLLTKKLPKKFLLLIVVFAVNLFFLRFYWGERHFTYLFYLEPFVLIFFTHMLFLLTKIKKYGNILFLAGLTIITAFMLHADLAKLSNNHMGISSKLNTLQAQYPQQSFSFYACNTTNNVTARSMAYFFSFKPDHQGESIKIGLPRDNLCHFHNTMQYNFTSATVSAKFATKVYPFIKDTGLIDLSEASESAIQNAQWQKVTTRQILRETTDWWK